MTPLLLGARALEAGKDFGYAGRLALFREDKREADEGTPKDLNANWDCGVFLSSPITDFDEPAAKLQIKNKRAGRGGQKRSNRAGSYKKAGIKPVSAMRFGFGNTEFIKQVCRAELKMTPTPEEIQLLAKGSVKLDKTTEGLFNYFNAPLTAVAEEGVSEESEHQ